MTLRRWTFDGFTSTTVLSIGNSSLHGDPALGAVSITGTAYPPSGNYVTSRPAGTGMTATSALEVKAGVGDVVLARTATWTAVSQMGQRVLMYFNGAFPSVSLGPLNGRSSTANQYGLNVDTTGHFYLTDNNSGAAQLTATTVIAINTWYVVDIWVSIGTTNANSSGKWRVRKLSDLSAVDSKSSTTLDLNHVAASPALLVSAQIGKTATPGGMAAGSSIYFSDWRVDDGAADYLSDAATPLSIVATPTPTSGTAPLAVSLAVVPTGGTGTAISYTVDWKDGSTSTATTSSNPATFSHTYASQGNYVGTVTAANT